MLFNSNGEQHCSLWHCSAMMGGVVLLDCDGRGCYSSWHCSIVMVGGVVGQQWQVMLQLVALQGTNGE